MTIWTEQGRAFSFAFKRFPLLAKATAKQRSNFQFVANGWGMHWPDIDEDLGLHGFLWEGWIEKVDLSKLALPDGQDR